MSVAFSPLTPSVSPGLTEIPFEKNFNTLNADLEKMIQKMMGELGKLQSESGGGGGGVPGGSGNPKGSPGGNPNGGHDLK